MPDSVQTEMKTETDTAHAERDAREGIVGLPETLQQAADLLNQQLWCWGQDIEASGNLLVCHGFRRIEKPPGASAASIYRLELSPTSRVILRGFGIFFGHDPSGGVFLPRFEFAPLFSPEADLSRPAWKSQDLPPLTSPSGYELACCQSLLLTLTDWIRRYEIWIAEHVGIDYRNRTLAPWKANHDSVVPAEEMAVAWRVLGLAISEQPERFIRCLESQSVPDA